MSLQSLLLDSKLTQDEKFRAKSDSRFLVHSQDGDCHSAGRSTANDQAPTKLEVITPDLAPRIEQTLNPIAIGVYARQVRTFKRVASLTREGEVRCVVGAPMLTRKDMFDVKSYVRLG